MVAACNRESANIEMGENRVTIESGQTTHQENSPMPTSPPSNPTPPREVEVQYKTMVLGDGTTLEYGLMLPVGFQADQSYPILLALPPGNQSKEMVNAGLGGYWAEGPATGEWIVVSPIAPGGRLFFQGSESLLPEFLEKIKIQHEPEGDKFHLAGISNGGISAFRIAISEPRLFHSLMVIPGFPRGEDANRLENLRGIPVSMYVGEFDTDWRNAMEQTLEKLQSLGIEANLRVVSGEGHVIQSIDGIELFEVLNSYR